MIFKTHNIYSRPRQWTQIYQLLVNGIRTLRYRNSGAHALSSRLCLVHYAVLIVHVNLQMVAVVHPSIIDIAHSLRKQRPRALPFSYPRVPGRD